MNEMRQGNFKSFVRNRKRAQIRAGSIYIMAMGTSLIIACLAVVGLQAVRVQRRSNEALLQTANAGRLAQCGIEFAQQTIVENANWRTRFVHGVPVSRSTTGGSFSVTLTDPDDGSIANQTTDPVVIKSTGVFGSSTQTLSVYLEPQNQLLAACRSSLYAVSEITFDSCSVSSNQWAFSEDKMKEIGTSTVNVNCLASQSLRGACYKQRIIQGGIWPMNKPVLDPVSPNYVGKYYIDNAFTINATDLPTGGTELIKNGEFETDMTNWTDSGSSPTRDTSQKKNGVASCLVSGRSLVSTPIQEITEHMIKDRLYTVSFWIRTTEDQDVFPVITSIGSGSLLPTIKAGSNVSAKSGVWTFVSSTFDVSWSGRLTRSEFQIGTTKNSNYHFDSASVKDAERDVGTRYIENVRLGYSNNPFGTKAVSSNGMYVINAPEEKLVIRNCRINATLAIQDSAGVELRGAISWEPFGRNFPALISKEAINDLTAVSSLSESSIGVNLNPTDTPYLGSADTDVSDTYPTVLSGAIVSFRDISLDGVALLTGPVISNQKLVVKSSNLTINFPSDMLMNPPPSFYEDPPKMRLNYSSIQSTP